MKVYLCALAKNEHLYINEWVNHYLKLGVDKIFIFDNDNKDAPYIGDYIDKECLPKIRIINARGVHRPKMQHDFYTNFYNIQKDNFDWCLFCDIDEFLFGITDFHSWLMQPQIKNALQIRVKWKLFGDDDLIERDMTKSVVETFTHEVKSSLHRNLEYKGNLEMQGKALVRGGLDNVIVRSPHFASFSYYDNVIPSLLPNGKPCYSKVAITEDYSNINVYLHHYMTKSLSEFIEQKLNRTDAVYGNTLPLDYYWRINKKTNKKIEYLRQKGFNV